MEVSRFQKCKTEIRESNILTYLLTPWSRVLLEKLTSQLYS